MAISGRNLSWSETTYNVSGYGDPGTPSRWSSFMDSYAISFVPSNEPVENVNGKSYSGTAEVTLSQAGVYKIKVAADNKDYSSAKFGDQNLSIGDLNDTSSELPVNSYTVAVGLAPKTVTLSITIGNQNAPAATNFAENPMGMAILIEEPGSKSETEGAGQDCPPGPWVPAIPSCASAPRLVSNTTNGLQIKKSGSSSVILNLKNYANKLVTLKVVVEKNAKWINGFSSSITKASDIVVDGSVQDPTLAPYSKSAYSESSLGDTPTTIHFCNLDGGDYDYTFTHSSTPDPADQPRRAINELRPSTSQYIDDDGDLVTKTVYTCQQVDTEYYPTWPVCTPGVAITKNGGDEVRWCYEDGGGAPFCDQTVTVTVLSTRDVIPTSGDVCFTDIVDKVWIDDPAVSLTNISKIWSNGVSSNGLLISGTEGLMFDGSTSTKVTTQGEGLVDFIYWNKDNAVNLVGLTGPVKLQMVYKDTHKFIVNDEEVSITTTDLEDGDIALVEIAGSGAIVDSFKVEATDNQTPVEIYAVTQGVDNTIVVDDADFIAEGKSLTDYKKHSTKTRFRDPASRSSKTTLPDPLCFTDFRGLAGAKTPSELGII